MNAVITKNKVSFDNLRGIIITYMKFKTYFLLTFALLFSVIANAQGPPPFDPDVDDATAPIPGLAAAALIALGIGAYKTFKKK